MHFNLTELRIISIYGPTWKKSPKPRVKLDYPQLTAMQEVSVT